MSDFIAYNAEDLAAAVKGWLGARRVETQQALGSEDLILRVQWDLTSLRNASPKKFIEQVSGILRDISSRISYGEVSELRMKNEALQKQVADLERFRTYYEMGRGK